MGTRPPKQKLYCYVDETGQHTDGQLFFVAVVIVGRERDDLRRQLTMIEESSAKHLKKWVRSRPTLLGTPTSWLHQYELGFRPRSGDRAF